MGYGAAISAEPGLRAVGGTGCIDGGEGRLGAAELVCEQRTDCSAGGEPRERAGTPSLGPRGGGIGADLPVPGWGEERFFIITGSPLGTHALDWIRRPLPADGSVVA